MTARCVNPKCGYSIHAGHGRLDEDSASRPTSIRTRVTRTHQTRTQSTSKPNVRAANRVSGRSQPDSLNCMVYPAPSTSQSCASSATITRSDTGKDVVRVASPNKRLVADGYGDLNASTDYSSGPPDVMCP